MRTIQVFIDRESILPGAAAGDQAWKYYDLGDGHCSYGFQRSPALARGRITGVSQR